MWQREDSRQREQLKFKVLRYKAWGNSKDAMCLNEAEVAGATARILALTLLELRASGRF